jgi:hypothetical protein
MHRVIYPVSSSRQTQTILGFQPKETQVQVSRDSMPQFLPITFGLKM